MAESIKFPNPNSIGKGQSFCKKSKCQHHNSCMFAFNSVMGGREMRVDFNLCNLDCVLCWSNNRAPSMMLDTYDLLSRFMHCIARKDEYLLSQYPHGVQDGAAFNTSCLQIVGGEPLLSRERFLFILDFLRGIDQYIQEHQNASAYLTLNRKKQFKIKIFTNGICIGRDIITDSDLLALDGLEYLDVRILLSFKGLNQAAANQLQATGVCNDLLSLQVKALEKLLHLPFKNITVEPVLGFYHSCDFNIKTAAICAEDMFVFDFKDPVSARLHELFKKHIASKGKVFVEPVHSVPQSKKGKEEFFSTFKQYLEINPLIEPDLKGGSRKNIKETRLASVI